MNELALFAGAGGGILGGSLLGWRTVAAVEIEDYPRRVLLQRQADGCLPRFPIWDDVRTFDGRPWWGRVDVVTGGFPCQDISCAGKGAGITGERSGLWSEMARIVGEVRPRFVFVENSPMLVSRGLDVVLGDLAEMGYDAAWGVVGAHHLGAPHKRDRVWILADAECRRRRESPAYPKTEGGAFCATQRKQGAPFAGSSGKTLADATRVQQGRAGAGGEPISDADRSGFKKQRGTIPAPWWESEPALGRVAHGVADRVGQLAALGNGQVPCVAARAFLILQDELAKFYPASNTTQQPTC